MCGIAGVISANTVSSHHSIDTIFNSLIHRGPDSSGRFFCELGSKYLCLIHHRLAIRGLGQSGSQPMHSECGRYVLIYNGEIYNVSTLCRLSRSSSSANTPNSDTEALLYYLIAKGESGIKYIRGMFSFAFYDKEKRRLLVARDPLGIKPLYYSLLPDKGLIFASELRSIVKSQLFSSKIDEYSLASYLFLGYYPQKSLPLKDIHELPCSSILVWQDDKISISPYTYDSKYDAPAFSHEALYSSLIFKETVLAHLSSDVPVVTFLSSGIDSSVILNCSHDFPGITSLSVGFSNSSNDESLNASDFSRQYGVPNKQILCDPLSEEYLPIEYFNSMDVPSIDGLNTYYICREASKLGFKVGLSGVGGDELFAGYPSFSNIPKMLRLYDFGNSLNLIPAGQIWQMLPPSFSRLRSFFSFPKSLNSAYLHYRGISDPYQISRVLKILGFSISPSDIFEYTMSRLVSSSPEENLTVTQRIAVLEASNYLRYQLLRDTDVFSMACGFELRVPFVDTLFNSSVNLVDPATRLQLGKKYILDLFPSVAKHLGSRKKQGFSFPLSAWLENMLQIYSTNDCFLNDIISVRQSEKFTSPQLWSYLALSRWLEINAIN